MAIFLYQLLKLLYKNYLGKKRMGNYVRKIGCFNKKD